MKKDKKLNAEKNLGTLNQGTRKQNRPRFLINVF
jgi:hypothetical protein